jgi:hypothetical protein
MEFFCGYPGEDAPRRFVHGADLLQRLDKQFDSQTGRPHSISQNIILTRALGYIRPHLALAKDAPLPRPVQRLGQVVARPILGGLHQQYCRT